MSALKSPAPPKSSAGSPGGDRLEFLAVGKLRRPHGLRGEILMDVYTDFSERLKQGVELYLGDERQPVHLRSVRQHPPALLVAFEGYASAEEVAQLRNQVLYVPAGDRPPLPDGEYYHHQILGLRVVDQDGRELGIVADILPTGANDVFVVHSKNNPEILIPALESVIAAVDLEAGVMQVNLLPGLLGSF